jgi:lipopolysaccharide transport system ATP-binding protein
MSDIAIKVENISKQYRIGLKEELHDSLIGKVGSFLKSPFLNLIRLKKLSHFDNEQDQDDIIWALKDISFEVKCGEVLGIIGANGAGKSSLLKILSKITEPSSGQVQINGRIASLLEVGTGMHSELTGRENIYQNGTILGMTKKEIDLKLDEIIDFSGVGKFIDTPVKRFSSGMSVRLGFSVAAHLDPETLLIDEVLAVGDARFRKKCLNKMKTISKMGRTVLFVSHNMAAIKQLCTTCILLNEGKIIMKGNTTNVIDRYFKDYVESQKLIFTLPKMNLNKSIQLLEVRIMTEIEEDKIIFNCDEPIIMKFKYIVRSPIPGIYGYLSISKSDENKILVSLSNDMSIDPMANLKIGISLLSIKIPKRTLGPGDYRVSISLASKMSLDGFIVDSPGIIGAFTLNDYNTIRGNDREGHLSTILDWQVSNENLKSRK